MTSLIDITGTAISIFSPLAAIAFTAAVGWLAPKGAKLLGLKNDAAVRDALHKAADAGLRAAAAKGFLPSSTTAISDAIEYVQTMQPAAVKSLKASNADLKQIVQSKVPDVMNTVAPAVPVVAVDNNADRRTI